MGPTVLCVGLCQPVSWGFSSKQRSYKGDEWGKKERASRLLFRRLIISTLLFFFFLNSVFLIFFLSVSKDTETPEVLARQAWV